MEALRRAVDRREPVRGFAVRSPVHGLRRGRLGGPDVLAQSVAAVAPTAAATTVTLLVAGVAGDGAVYSVLLAALLALSVAWTVNLFARRLAATGSLYTYAARGSGPATAFVAGAALLVGYAFIGVFALLGGVLVLEDLARRLVPGLDGGAVQLATLAAEIAVLTIVVVRGIRLSARVALVVECLSVLLVLALVVALLVAIGPQPVLASLERGAAAPPGSVVAGAVLGLTAFVGFESATTLGAEVRAPLRTIPRAIVGTVVVAGVLYALAATAQVAGTAGIPRRGDSSGVPLVELAALHGAGVWTLVADIAVAASFLACAIASTTALARVLFTMGRDGAVPAVLGTTRPLSGTPLTALLIGVAAVGACPVALIVSGATPWDAMRAVIVVSAGAFITAYVIVCVSAPRFLARIGERTVAATVIPLAAAGLLTTALVLFIGSEAAGGNPGVLVLALTGAAVAGVAVVRHRSGVPAMRGAGVYDEPVVDDVLGGVPGPLPERHGS